MWRTAHHALAREAILACLTVYQGVTTADGAAGGGTLVDANLIGSNDFVTNKMILIGSGDAFGEDKGVASFDSLTGEITLVQELSAQIRAGTLYRILNVSSVEQITHIINEKIGETTDLPGAATLFGRLASIIAGMAQDQGLAYHGVVTGVPDATHFDISSLTGFGDNRFRNYQAYITRLAGGGVGAPLGETQPIIGYDTASGRFTHAAFSVGLVPDDEVLILQERIAEVLEVLNIVTAVRTQTDKLTGQTPVTGNPTANWNSGVATSGSPGADLVTLGTGSVRYKVHSLLVSMANMTPGATITVRMYAEINGTEREVYNQTFTQGTDPDGLWIINGSLGIHEELRVELHSNNAADDGRVVEYDYMMEEM